MEAADNRVKEAAERALVGTVLDHQKCCFVPVPSALRLRLTYLLFTPPRPVFCSKPLLPYLLQLAEQRAEQVERSCAETVAEACYRASAAEESAAKQLRVSEEMCLNREVEAAAKVEAAEAHARSVVDKAVADAKVTAARAHQEAQGMAARSSEAARVRDSFRLICGAV